ncbi:MAG: hypothetical protein A2X05_16815 [Bacteroidetes bacterium GWE2_41_25]|nr:MAG: hypothetical protein A2X03_03260 [Bacteroidetes bacterium GWA2_40_15]OFY01663.1 MAG: hypothetical protein A2X06_06190 [Bacteroidetes bacterium GWC2_40_22]OFY07205.1 MAG: hypothetical protein A2X05_16815 [Bacteroidetes bacterium GWE2_41_25]OFY57221.1 MAG: hypothetical protein A2X04_16460 [Bacteroidetes bacterium GWF2_41_9]HAM09952.1 hypothetical protein [Bacteroidales bacterium]
MIFICQKEELLYQRILFIGLQFYNFRFNYVISASKEDQILNNEPAFLLDRGKNISLRMK